MASNFAVIGSKLNEFIVKLFDKLEWTSQIDRMVAATPGPIKDGTNLRRLVMVTFLAERLLGPLDVVPDWSSNSDRSLTQTADLFHYFEHLGRVLFFTPIVFLSLSENADDYANVKQ